jgi:diguanylate cyclase (GGDEF)-like protein/PAS domain S-box-containing protein
MSVIPPIPKNEQERLTVLRELLVLDSGPEPIFDNIARMAAEICGTPIGLLSLVDGERQWFKANVGLHGVTETPRNIAFCAHTILGRQVLEVFDATKDVRFSDNPLVTSAPDIRFYAGAPLVITGGECVGTLCVIDQEARKLDDGQLRMLRTLAEIASNALTMRRDLLKKSMSVRSEYEQELLKGESHYRAIVEDQLELISLANPDGQLKYVNPAYARHFGLSPEDMADKSLFDYVSPSDREPVRALLAQVALTGQSAWSENQMISADGQQRWVAWTNGVQRDEAGRITLHSVGRDVTARKKAEEALRASQSFLYRTGRVAGVGGWQVDIASGAVNWSEQTRRIHDVPSDYVPTLESAIAFYAAEARAVIEKAVQAGIERGESWDLELPLTTAAGRNIWVRAVGSVEYESGRAVRLVGAFQDVSERKALEDRIVQQTATLSLVTEAIPATVAVVDLEGRYRFVNGAFERWCGKDRRQVIGRSAREVLGEREFERRWPWVERAFNGETVVFELDYPHGDASTHVSLTYIPLRLPSGTVDGFVVVTQDVTQQRREALRLLELSQRDPLTGLLNRTGFEQYLERNLLEGGGASLALLYIDLDRFKPVNDRYGHAVGDQVLKMFGRRLTKLVRPTDAVARLGGDEFAIALAGTREPANARAVADKVLAAACSPFEIGEVDVEIGASVGVAFSADPVSGWADLVERADAKLLTAKAAGKGRQRGETD